MEIEMNPFAAPNFFGLPGKPPKDARFAETLKPY